MFTRFIVLESDREREGKRERQSEKTKDEKVQRGEGAPGFDMAILVDLAGILVSTRFVIKHAMPSCTLHAHCRSQTAGCTSKSLRNIRSKGIFPVA